MRNFLILSFITLTNLLYAQQIKEKALLWEISGNGIESPSYLFGTIHLACEGDVLMTDEIRTAFNKSSDLMLEIDMSDPKVLMEMMSIVNSNDGIDRKSTRLNSSHVAISYAVFCLKKKKQ